jgi:hypothetical protein
LAVRVRNNVSQVASIHCLGNEVSEQTNFPHFRVSWNKKPYVNVILCMVSNNSKRGKLNMFATSTQRHFWMFKDETDVSNARLSANIKYISSRGRNMTVSCFQLFKDHFGMINMVLFNRSQNEKFIF